MTILNLTQHRATPEQITAGVVDLLSPDARDTLADMLNFVEPPTPHEISGRAGDIALLAYDVLREEAQLSPRALPHSAMIGGAPWLMPALEAALRARGIRPVYAFSKREVIEEPRPNTLDGGMIKRTVFRHAGFVAPPRVAPQEAVNPAWSEEARRLVRSSFDDLDRALNLMPEEAD